MRQGIVGSRISAGLELIPSGGSRTHPLFGRVEPSTSAEFRVAQVAIPIIPPIWKCPESFALLRFLQQNPRSPADWPPPPIGVTCGFQSGRMGLNRVYNQIA